MCKRLQARGEREVDEDGRSFVHANSNGQIHNNNIGVCITLAASWHETQKSHCQYRVLKTRSSPYTVCPSTDFRSIELEQFCLLDYCEKEGSDR